MLAKYVDPDQTPHDVASEMGLHCLPMALFVRLFVRISQTYS